jgi:hypothetical protein
VSCFDAHTLDALTDLRPDDSTSTAV